MPQHLTPLLVLFVLLLYFGMLVTVAWRTGRNVGNEGFFLANRRVPWYVVAYAMIGTSISGVTFISIPGKVGGSGLNMAFSYLQVVMGYLLGYLVIATVLMPLYYRLQLTSIYGYLEQRFGSNAHKVGSAFFLLSRTVGSAGRMFLAAAVLQTFVFNALGVPFPLTVLFMLGLIYLYTYQGGLKTIIWTDTIMTTFFLAAVGWTVVSIAKALNYDAFEVFNVVGNSPYSKVFFWENPGGDPNHFIKQFIGGAFIALAMTGLDQDLMQKNLACKNIREAQKNMLVFCIYMVLINVLFLLLGALLYLYSNTFGLTPPANSDHLYPQIAFHHLDTAAGVFFILGLIASTYASSDSALTALTTSFCVDFLHFEKSHSGVEEDEYRDVSAMQTLARQQKRTRTLVHLGFSLLFLAIILLFYYFTQDSVINLVLKYAGFTYGPLLGLFGIGLLTDLKLHRRWIVPVCVAAPVLTWLIEYFAMQWYHFNFGLLTIALNGLLAFGGLWAISYREENL